MSRKLTVSDATETKRKIALWSKIQLPNLQVNAWFINWCLLRCHLFEAGNKVKIRFSLMNLKTKTHSDIKASKCFLAFLYFFWLISFVSDWTWRNQTHYTLFFIKNRSRVKLEMLEIKFLAEKEKAFSCKQTKKTWQSFHAIFSTLIFTDDLLQDSLRKENCLAIVVHSRYFNLLVWFGKRSLMWRHKGNEAYSKRMPAIFFLFCVFGCRVGKS